MQKKTTARHVGIWMVFFLTKYLIRSVMIETRVSRWLIFIAIWNNKIATSHFNEENSLLGEIIVPQRFWVRPRVFHQNPRFSPDPVFSRIPGTRPRVFHLAAWYIYFWMQLFIRTHCCATMNQQDAFTRPWTCGCSSHNTITFQKRH